MVLAWTLPGIFLGNGLLGICHLSKYSFIVLLCWPRPTLLCKSNMVKISNKEGGGGVVRGPVLRQDPP